MDFGNVIGESPVNVVSVTVPETPVRPSPQRPESGCNLNTKLHVGFDLNSIQSGMEVGVSSDACPSTSDKGATQDFCAGVNISKEEAPKMVNAPSTPASKQSLKKRGNNGIDLNKNPSKRPKMKRHRPKILDIFKTKKVPKPKTEKPVKRKYVKKAKPKQEFVQEGEGNKVKPYEILNPVTPERSIPNHAMIIETPSERPALEETVEAGQELKATTTPCKRALIFNMEEDLIEEKAPFKWDLNLQDQDFDSCPHLHKIVKDHRDGEKKSLTKSQIKRGGVGGVGEVKSNPGQSKALIVYRRAFKPNLCKSVIVYQRTFKPDQCEKNCRKLGPNFPKICKQKRAIRKRREDCMMILEKLLGGDDNNSLMKRILRPRNQIRTAKASKRVNPLHPKAKATRKRLMSYTSKGNDSNALTPSFFNLVIRKKRSKLILRKRVFPNPLPMMVPQACSKDKALIEFMNQEPEGLGTTTMTTTTNSTQLVVQDQTNHGAILPYEPKKKKYQAKVIVDAITLSKWNALMENIPEPFDEEKDKFWNSERLAFSLLVRHFIRQMYHVQGNRKFQFWGGTVIESVIGAFLTQNVSDHLSSSAYMKLRATFPEKEKKTEKPKCPCVGGDKERCLMCREKIQDVLDLFAYKDSDEEISASTPARNDLVSAPEAAPESVPTPAQNDLASAPESVPTPARNDLVSAPEAAPTPARNDLTSVPEAALESVPELEQTASFREVIDTEMKLYLEKYVTESSSGPSSLEKEALSLEKGPSSLEKAPLSLEKAPSTPEPKTKKKREPKPPPPVIDWDELRRTYAFPLREPVKGSIDMEAIRAASNEQVANTIAMRGQHRIIGGRIKDLLDRLVKDHGSTDLEWLRDVPPEKAKDFLLSIKGLGLKSVECIRLLTLHHIAFPVDVNVGRVAVRLGWVPLEPLPDGVQIHLLNSYPMMDSIQKYLWPRLCTLDQETLYELHYQLITFGKIFCTKIQPNCNACPMKIDCRHFKSAFVRFV